MAPISLDSVRFYVPPSQVPKPGPSAQKMPPASSMTAAATAFAVSTGGREAQGAEARPRDQGAPPTDNEMGSLWPETTEAGPSEKPTVSANVKHVQDNEGTSGTVVLSDLHFAVLRV